MNRIRNRTRGLWPACGVLVAHLLAVGVAPAQSIDPPVNGKAIVRLVGGAAIGDFNAQYGTTTLRAVASRNIYLVQIAAGSDPQQFKNDAEADPATVWVELNYYGQVPEARGRCFYTTPNADAQQYLNQSAWGQISLPAATQQSTGDGVVVALVDSGIDATHITLSNAILPGGWNFVDDTPDTADVGDNIDNDGDGLTDEMTGHGTHVAGIVRMVAPDAWLLPIKVLDSEGLSDNFTLAAGIFYAIDQGADVINISVGSTYDSPAVRDAVVEAQTQGIVVVAAGGNADTHSPEEYPALNTGVIGVASVNEADQKGWFSNWHEGFVVNAPGEQIFSTFPGNLYTSWDGTSMSTPMVAGVAALILTRHPEWPRDGSRVNNVRIALMQSADNVDDVNPDYAGMLGAGRINAAAALSVVDAFASAVAYPVGAGPEAVATGDFDEDGVADLAVVNALENTVSVLLHDTTGTFAGATSLAVGTLPCDVAAGDFNGDGHLDLAVANETSMTVAILNGAGDGTFAPPQSVALGASPSALVAADFDGDDDTDLAVAREATNDVLVLLNDGGGTFTPATAAGAGVRPRDLSAADLNGDQLPDLVTVNRNSNNVSVLLNLGDGTFAPAVHYPVGGDPRAVTIADFDGDGAADIAAANHDTRDISLLWNDGTGAFGVADTLAFADGRRAAALVGCDLNCDGVADLAASTSVGGVSSTTVFLSRADRSFFAPVHYAVDPNPAGLTAADLDGDLDRDLAIVSADAATVSVLLNQTSAFCGDGLFGDLDGDCRVDLGDLARLLAHYGSGTGMTYADGDLDKDGDVDLADLASLLAAYGDVCS